MDLYAVLLIKAIVVTKCFQGIDISSITNDSTACFKEGFMVAMGIIFSDR